MPSSTVIRYPRHLDELGHDLQLALLRTCDLNGLEVWVNGLQGDAGVTVRCRLIADESPSDIHADYAVACAGARGEDVRRMLGVNFEGHSFDDRFLICDIRADLPDWSHERRFYFDPEWNPGRQVLIHPCPDSIFRIDWQVPGDYDLEAEQSGGALDARITAIIGDRPYEIVWKSVYRFHSRIADRFKVGRVLLAGDCAHLVAPFGARGLNSGVWDAENAAWKLAFVLRGWAGVDLLASYHEERHAAAAENLEVTTATMDFLVPHGERQRARRLAVLDRATVDPAERANVDSGRLAEPFWYAESPLTTADADRPFAGRPARGCVPPAGPGVLIPDVPVSVAGAKAARLRQLGREGFLLVVGEELDTAVVRAAAGDAMPGPLGVFGFGELDATGALAEALRARQDEVWVIRPDAHVAAVLHRPTRRDVVDAVRRAVGEPARSMT
jgi:3-(3-hydroxy-phenyl)propionate hydroxylase